MFSKYSSINIEGIVNSTGYKDFEAALQDRIEAHKERLVSADDPGQVTEYQSRIKELRYLVTALAKFKGR